MKRHGENWVSILKELVKEETAKNDLVTGLNKLTGDIEDVRVTSAAGHLIAEFKQQAKAKKGKRWFDAAQQSDGTLRVAGLLTALGDVLDDLAREHGVHATSQVSVRVSDLRLIEATMARLRSEPPQSLGGLDVLAVDDLLQPAGGLPPTDGLRLHLHDAARVIVRPSGTEPKVKCYLEVVTAVQDGDVASARSSAHEQMQALRADVAALLAEPT